MGRLANGIRAAAVCALGLAVVAAGAQARKVHEYRLHEQEDRGAPFGMTLGPDHTVYTILPRRDGNWILSEVKNWWLDKPGELGIVVEGYPSRDPIAHWDQMDLAVTPDGQYLVAFNSADMRAAADDPYPMDMTVEIIRTSDFSVLDTEHLRALGMRGRLRGGLDRAGHLLVRSEIGPSGTGAFDTWFSLAIPEMKPQLACSYDGNDAAAMEGACAAFAKTEGYGSAADMATAVWPTPPPSAPQLPAGVVIASKDRWQSAVVTIDGKPVTLVVVNGVELETYEVQ